ncbi:amidophosphoribosyltransferase [bacterium]|nr:amidophosphoribosyltransferase [bacterium]
MCGIYGICQDKECISSLMKGIFQLQHRGQRFCGMTTSNGKKLYFKEPLSGLVKQGLALAEFKGEMGIAHVSLKERQPLLVEKSKLEEFAIAFSGKIYNREELEEEYEIFSSRAPSTEILAKIIRRNGTFAEGIEKIFEIAKGGYSLVIISPNEGIYAARDPYGFRPCVLGKRDKKFAIASESVALEKIGMKVIRDLQPGEIVLITKNGFQTVNQLMRKEAFCSFEWAYFARISSVLEGIPVKRARMNMGKALASRDNVEADLVAPIPFSGIGHALGYARASGIPYEEVFEYNRYSDRSYMPLEQEKRTEIAEEKLSEIDETIKGNRIIIIDDSIVRATQIRKLIYRLKEKGAKEVHVRIASPPLVAPCRYNISTRQGAELVAANHSLDEIKKMIGADTLRYNELDDFVRAIGLPKEKLCLACFGEKYPL